MDKIRIINAAKQYLSSKNIDFAEPGELGRINGNLQEVIFLDPLIFDPNVAFAEFSKTLAGRPANYQPKMTPSNQIYTKTRAKDTRSNGTSDSPFVYSPDHGNSLPPPLQQTPSSDVLKNYKPEPLPHFPTPYRNDSLPGPMPEEFIHLENL